MTTKTELKLEQVLRNNPLIPIVIAGKKGFEAENFVPLPAGINERELHIPSGWHKLLDLQAQDERVYLVIEGLDEAAPVDQDKFTGLLKDRRAGNYKLPANAQIVIPVRDKEKLSEKIRALVLVWDIK